MKYPVGGGGGSGGATSILSVNNNSSSSTNNTGQLNNVTQMANQLYVGKPPDWLIYEEAALYLVSCCCDIFRCFQLFVLKSCLSPHC